MSKNKACILKNGGSIKGNYTRVDVTHRFELVL